MIKNSFIVRGDVIDIQAKCTIKNKVDKNKRNLLSLSHVLFDLQKEMVPTKKYYGFRSKQQIG